MSKVLFEITEDQLETGLRGVPVGYCVTSSVDPEKGLFYMGRPLSELANWEPENVIYLLYHGKEGSESDIDSFKNEIRNRSQVSKKVLDYIRALPREAHPMKLLSMALMICGELEGKGDYREDALDVVSKLPTLVAALISHHAGWGDINNPKPELGYMENFTHMLKLPDEMMPIFKLFNVLHYDHGGGNLSVFTGKTVASGLEGMYGSLAASMNALAGPRHGKANQDSLRFVNEALDEIGENAGREEVENFLRKRLENKELIYGFGHAVLRVEDPRATVMYRIANEKYPDHPLVKTALLLREVGPKVLSENPKIGDPYPNVDAISGTLLTTAGFPHPEYYTVLFGLSRCVGISRQIVYERLEARGGKGTPIIRPKYFFRPLQESL